MDCLGTHLANLREIEILAEAARRALGLMTPDGRIEGNAITRSGLVLLCGYLEGFIRELLEEAVDELNESSLNIVKLPSALLYNVVEDQTESFRKTRRADSFKVVPICRNEIPPKFNKNKLSKTGGNPTVDTIEALFESFGVSDVIEILSIRDYTLTSTYITESQVSPNMRTQLLDLIEMKIGEQAPTAVEEIVAVIEQKWAARKKRRAVGYVNEINELLKRRNRIAHGESPEPVTPDELVLAKKMVEKLTTGLHDMIEEKIAAILVAA